ncbi:MAG TPA: 6-bladed beta-propeller, partial [Nitrospirota bacterium]
MNGLVYVADTGNVRVQVLTADGIFVRQVTAKIPRDEMKAPVGVAVDVQNRVYVLDPGSNRVRVFDPAGNQVAAFGSRGAGVQGFEKPQGIAVDNRGNIYVADTGNYKIKKFDGRGKLLGSIGGEGRGQAQFLQATGLLVDREARIWVADAGKNTIQVFTGERDESRLLAPEPPPAIAAFSREIAGEVTDLAINKRPWGLRGDSLSVLGVYEGRSIGTRGSEPASLRNAQGIAVDGQGNFWVADTGNDRLQKFSLEGNLLHVIGKSGSREGEFRSPCAIAASPKGKICVADAGNKRVQVLNSKGIFLGAFGKAGKLPGQFNDIADLTVDAAENIYIVDRGNDRIAKYDSNGGLLWEAGKTGKQEAEFHGPENITVSPDNEVYVLDAGNARVQVFDGNGKFLRMFGSEGSDAGQFRTPRGLALEEGIRLYVGDRGNKRVQVFTLRHTPAVPGDVAAQARANEIQLSWKANTETFLDQYRIYRADSPAGVFTLIGVASSPFYLDKNLQSNRAYHYRVGSQAREGNESVLSSVVSAVTPKLVPAAPKRVRGEAQEKQITLSWLPNLEPFMSHYRVYRTREVSAGFELLAKTDKTLYVDGPLPDETVHYYQIVAVGKEEDESPPSEVVVASTPKAALTVPPLEIVKIEAGEVFASAYKYYEAHPLGKVVIMNNTDLPIQKAKLSFSIRDYMDYPTDTEIAEIPAKQQAEFPLTPLFNNRILEVTENTPLQSEIAVTVYANGEPRTVKRSFPLTLYERHAMRWDQKAKLGAFVTHKDPAIADFSRMVVQQYVDAYPNLPQAIVYARGIYGALGVLGLKYIVDPSSPFSEFSGKSTAVDYLQYPRDTLARKSGDCDDLSVLFAACMENIGIDAAFVDVP